MPFMNSLRTPEVSFRFGVKGEELPEGFDGGPWLEARVSVLLQAFCSKPNADVGDLGTGESGDIGTFSS